MTPEMNLDSLPDEEDVTKETLRPYTMKQYNFFLDYEPPEGSEIMLNDDEQAIWRKGEPAMFVGPPGVGKTRAALQLAITQIIARTGNGYAWCGLQFGSPPLKWLFIGTENNILRIKEDLTKMTAGFSDQQRELIQNNLLIHVVEDIDDADISLCKENILKLERTIGEYKPDILVVDPFEALLPDGNSNDMSGVRSSIATVDIILKSNNPEGTVFFIHHARTGAANTKQAYGYDANNYVKGSKTSFSMARFVMNLAHADKEDKRKLVLVCGKSNNSKPFETRGLFLETSTMRYVIDDSFNAEDWINDVDGKRGNKSVCIQDIVNAIQGGHTRTCDIKAHVRAATRCSGATVDRYIADAKTANKIFQESRGVYTLDPQAKLSIPANDEEHF